MTTVTVFGGNGRIARILTRKLVARGDTVRSVIRDTGQVPGIEALGASPVLLDLTTAGSEDLAMAVQGADAVFWSAGGLTDKPWRLHRDAPVALCEAISRAASSDGGNRLVLVSRDNTNDDFARAHGLGDDYIRAKAAADQYIRGTPIDWTLLGPTGLSDDPDTGIQVFPKGVQAIHDRTSRELVADLALRDRHSIGRYLRFSDGKGDVEQAFAL